MFKNMKLGMKISMGFGLLIVIAGILGIVAVWNMKKVDKESTMLAQEYVPEVKFAVDLRGAANRVMYAMRGYSLTENEKYYNEAQKELELIDNYLEEGRALEKKSSNLTALKGQLKVATEAVTEYKGLVNQTKKTIELLDNEREKLDAAALDYIAACTEYLTGQNRKVREDLQNNKSNNEILERIEKITAVNDVIDFGNDARRKNYQSQAFREPALMEEGLENFPKINNKLEILKSLSSAQEDIERIERTGKAADQYKNSMIRLSAEWKKLNSLGIKRDEAGGRMIQACIETADAGIKNTDEIAKSAAASLSASSNVMITGLIIAVIAGILAAFFIIRSIVGPINRVIAGLNEGSEQVASASNQVSTASQTLAEGASEQAASIEETSSSLEEMASQTKQNADNAVEADSLMKDTGKVVEEANESMESLNKSMAEITSASEETFKIIKTIDEIAFQTNLLALNAAVEAARAGEAGAGFAVVAEEVRNLAMRSAEAAKNTSELIEGTVKKIKDGSELTETTNEAFSKVSESNKKVADLVAEIAAASNEQSKGIEQINIAVSQMDKVTQTNAANAEESASASEEMNAQAEQMKSIVGELSAMVSGSAEITQSGRPSYSGSSPKKQRFHVNKLHNINSEKSVSSYQSKNSSSYSNKSGKAQEISPDQAIPFDDDDDFEDWK